MKISTKVHAQHNMKHALTVQSKGLNKKTGIIASRIVEALLHRETLI